MSNDVGLTSLDGERGMPSVNGRKAPSPVHRAVTFTLFAATLLGIVYGLLSLKSAYAEDTDKKPTKEVNAPGNRAKRTFAFPDSPRRPATDNRPAAASSPTEDRPPAAIDTTGTETLAMLDRSAAPLMSKVNGNGLGATARARNDLDGDGAGRGALDGTLIASHTPMARAAMLPDRNFLLAKGTSIRCTLRTKIVSTIAGMTACTIKDNVFSDNGKVILIPRGSRAVGEYRANVARGAKRIGVLWSHADTPDGVRIQLNSPAADALGATGIPGWVDDHFWQRFGGAILVSLIDDTATALSNINQRRDGQTISFSGSGDAANDVASRAIENTINIPPTLYTNQGEDVVIFVARDLDFSGVYELTIED